MIKRLLSWILINQTLPDDKPRPFPDELMYKVVWVDGHSRWYDSYEKAKQAGYQRSRPTKLHKGSRVGRFYIREYLCEWQTGWRMG